MSAMLYITSSGGQSICSATPVYYNPTIDSTFFVTAAHCLTRIKTLTSEVSPGEVLNHTNIMLIRPNGPDSINMLIYTVINSFVREDYCQGQVIPPKNNIIQK